MKNTSRLISAVIIMIMADFIFEDLHSRKKKAASLNVMSPFLVISYLL